MMSRSSNGRSYLLRMARTPRLPTRIAQPPHAAALTLPAAVATRAQVRAQEAARDQNERVNMDAFKFGAHAAPSPRSASLRAHVDGPAVAAPPRRSTELLVDMYTLEMLSCEKLQRQLPAGAAAVPVR